MVNGDAKFGISLSWAPSPEGETSLQRHHWVLHCSQGGGQRLGFCKHNSIVELLCLERNVWVNGLELSHGLQRQKGSQNFGRKWEIWSGPSACLDQFKSLPPEYQVPKGGLGKNHWRFQFIAWKCCGQSKTLVAFLAACNSPRSRNLKKCKPLCKVFSLRSADTMGNCWQP